MKSLQKFHALQKVGSELYEKHKDNEILMQTAIDMYTIFYYPKKEIAYKLFGQETENSIGPLIIMLDILFEKKLDPKKREKAGAMIRKYKGVMSDTSSETQSRRGKLGGRIGFSKTELATLKEQRKNPLPSDIRQELFGMFKGRKEISMYSTRDNTFDLNTQTEKAAYEVLSRYLEEVHGIKKSRAALKSIISRLKNEDKKNSG